VQREIRTNTSRLHHSTEERILFPRLAKLTGEKEILQMNIEQHEAFHDGLTQFNAYVVDTRPADFEAGKLKALIDSFAAPLMEHFKAEIGSLMALKKYGAAVMKVHQEFEVEVRKRIDSVSNFPLSISLFLWVITLSVYIG
jgi:hemerythrin-like domain-containing protein